MGILDVVCNTYAKMPNPINSQMNEGESLIKSMSSKSIEIISDNSEVFFDSLLESGALKDIPIFGNIFKITSLGISIRDYLFTKKILTFLNSLTSINSQEKTIFLEKHVKDKKSREELGDKILYTLEKVDSNKKAEFIARAFKLYLKEKITKIEFYDLIYTIEQFKIHYIDLFIDFCLLGTHKTNIKPELIDHFYTCGLMMKDKRNDFTLIKNDDFDHEDTHVKFSNASMTDIARLLLTDILDEDKEQLKTKYINRIMDITPMHKNSTLLKKWSFVQELTKDKFNDLLLSYNLGVILKFDCSLGYASIYGFDNYNRITKLKNGNFQLHKTNKSESSTTHNNV